MKQSLGQVEFVSLMAILTALTALSIDTILPSFMSMRQDLGISDVNATQLVVSLFVFGMVFGDLIFGPLADAFGRKVVIQAGLILFVAGAIMAATAQSLEWVLIGRVLQGFGVAGPKVVTRAIVRDIYSGEAMARILSLIMSIMILAPMLGPLIGQTVLLAGTWRWVFVLFIIQALIGSVWLALRQPETLPQANRIPLKLGTLASNALAIATNAKVFYSTLAAGLLFGAILCYVSISQEVFVDIYGMGNLYPVLFGALAAPTSISALLNARFVERYGMMRLTMAAFIAIGVLAIAFMVAVVIWDGVPPFAVFFALCFCTAFCFGIVFGNVNAIGMEWLGRVAGLGASVISSASSLFAVIMTIPLGRLYDGTILPIALGYLIAGWGGALCLLMARRAKGVHV